MWRAAGSGHLARSCQCAHATDGEAISPLAARCYLTGSWGVRRTSDLLGPHPGRASHSAPTPGGALRCTALRGFGWGWAGVSGWGGERLRGALGCGSREGEEEGLFDSKRYVASLSEMGMEREKDV